MFNYRLPIDHPEYRYSTSKNPYSARLLNFQNLVYSDQETEQQSGLWKEKINPELKNSSKELHVEIGCNGGHVVLEWAAKNPEQAYIGIDWKFKPIHRGAEKAIQRGIKNISFLRAHAERLPYMFGPNEVDHLYLFFPDPWPKKAQIKNRFINEKRLRAIAPMMKPNGVFHIKTDHDGYFEWMLDCISRVNDCWKVAEISHSLHQNHPAPETLRIPDVTLFEALFIKDRIPIKSVKLKPNLL